MPHSLLSIVFVTDLQGSFHPHPPQAVNTPKVEEKSSKVKTESIFSQKQNILVRYIKEINPLRYPNRLGPKDPTTACDDRKWRLQTALRNSL